MIAFVVFSVVRVLANTTQENLEPSEPSLVITEDFRNIPHNPSTAMAGEDVEQGKEGSKDGSARQLIPKDFNSVYEFAWKEFVALNWPVTCQGNDFYNVTLPSDVSNKKYNTLIGTNPKNPRAWELYPSPKDLFEAGENGPLELKEIPEVKKCLGDGVGSEKEYLQTLRLTETGKLVGQEKIKQVKEVNEKGLLNIYGELKEDEKDLPQAIFDANNFPLVDQQGNYILNEIRLNPVEYKQIKENKWYKAENLKKLVEEKTTDVDWKSQEIVRQNNFKLFCSDGIGNNSHYYCGQEGYKDEGAIEIKAAWRVFDERNSEEEKAKYYTANRQLVNKSTEQVIDKNAELGLIGFHIMHKTGGLGWIWSTFQQIDNVPYCGHQDPKTMYTLYGNKCKTTKNKNCETNYPYVDKPYLWNISNDEPKAVTTEGILAELKEQIPSQICSYPIEKFEDKDKKSLLDKTNEEWQKALRDVNNKSVWQYYQLVGVQWLGNPYLPYENNKQDGHREIKVNQSQEIDDNYSLTNPAIEPYVQRASCIVCHTYANLPGKDNTGKEYSCGLITDNNENKEAKIAKIKACSDFSFLMDNAR
ncbi:MAG: hypothetical protein F6K47_25925 [Symploca sp. SIO2E6]|nr:hypothetical protein [Symploca sp. SIO2E6]